VVFVASAGLSLQATECGIAFKRLYSNFLRAERRCTGDPSPSAPRQTAAQTSDNERLTLQRSDGIKARLIFVEPHFCLEGLRCDRQATGESSPVKVSPSLRNCTWTPLRVRCSTVLWRCAAFQTARYITSDIAKGLPASVERMRPILLEEDLLINSTVLVEDLRAAIDNHRAHVLPPYL
jgi:hypothetical protein